MLSLGLAAVMATTGCGPRHGNTQLVNKSPAIVSKAFGNAFAKDAYNGASQFSNLWHGGMQTFVERGGDNKLDVITKFNGVTATEAHFTFTPKEGGKATLVAVDIAVDTAVMRKAFEGTPKQEMANLPEYAYAAGMRRLMADYAERIENGTQLNRASEGWQTSDTGLPPEFTEDLPDEVVDELERQSEQARRDNATAPMTDPNAAAREYLNEQ